VSKTKDGPSFI